MSTATLPVLALPAPLVLLPTARLTLPIPRAAGEVLLELIHETETQPVVAAVPLVSDPPALHPWGTAARVVRLVRPPSRTSKQPFLLTLHGLSRVRILDEGKSTFSPTSGVVERTVEYVTVDGAPSQESIATFKAAAHKLLDRMAQDSTQQSRKDSYNKIANMLDELSDQRVPWMADLLVAGLNTEHGDRLGTSSLLLCPCARGDWGRTLLWTRIFVL